MNEQLEQRVARAICNACDGPCEMDKNCICGTNQIVRAQAALKAHAEWLAEQGLVVVKSPTGKFAEDVRRMLRDHTKTA